MKAKAKKRARSQTNRVRTYLLCECVTAAPVGKLSAHRTAQRPIPGISLLDQCSTEGGCGGSEERIQTLEILGPKDLCARRLATAFQGGCCSNCGLARGWCIGTSSVCPSHGDFAVFLSQYRHGSGIEAHREDRDSRDS